MDDMTRIDKVLVDLHLSKGSGLIEPSEASARPSGEVYKCARCRDSGILHPRKPGGEVDSGSVVECECRKEENSRLRTLHLMRMCELPKGTENCRFDSFLLRPGLEEALKLAKEVATGRLKWLTLTGGVDVGKTHLAIAICRAWLERVMPAKYAYVPLLLEELRRGYGKEDEESFDYRFRLYCSIPLLVLDDLGSQSNTKWAEEKLDTIIDYRLVNDLSLVVTTNLGINELPVRLGSRLQRHGKVVFIEATEFRLRKGNE